MGLVTHGLRRGLDSFAASRLVGMCSAFAPDIMGSLSGTFYVGMAGNLHKRVFEHKFHRLEGFSDKYDVVRLLYWESFDEVVKAISREKQLKRWSRAKKIVLIESVNPRWEDLAREWYPWMTRCGGNRDPSTAL